MNFIAKLNLKLIAHVIGFLAVVNGAFMLISAGVSWYYNDGAMVNILIAGSIALGLGGLMMLLTKNYKREVKLREGFLIVSFGWVFMAFIGTLPYLISGAIPDLASAFFESMSGFTTTGATILNDIESIPKGILFWRSFTNWIGGMGMIVLAIAILPLLGIGGTQLFAAESPGPEGDKLSPRIADTAKRIWLIYVGYTVAETLLLRWAGMSFFDAVNHSMASLATGGFSTKNNSVAFWNDQPIIQYIITFFMFLGGVNFVLSYFGFKFKFKKIFKDAEFRLYAFIVALFAVITTLVVYFQVEPSQTAAHPMVWGELESAFRHAIFQVVSIITTTGFVTADFTMWSPFLTILFLGIMLIGASAGSTSGGPKVVRYLIMFKNGITEFKRMLHPNAVLPIRVNDKSIPHTAVLNVLGFFILYMLAFMVGTLVFALMGFDIITSLGSAASTLGNVGPGMGATGPIESFSVLPPIGKWWGSFLMLIGRLELFTVLILLTPFFWRQR